MKSGKIFEGLQIHITVGLITLWSVSGDKGWYCASFPFTHAHHNVLITEGYFYHIVVHWESAFLNQANRRLIEDERHE